jgi:hypothetical protein
MGVTHRISEMSGDRNGWLAVDSDALSQKFDGDIWNNPAVLSEFRLRAINQGTSVILHSEHSMSTTTGLDEYESSATNATVVIKKSDGYSDMSASAWYYDAVQDVTSANLFAGTGDNKFSPDVPMSRAMFVTVLGRLAEVDAAKYTGGTFTDVNAGEYYAPYVAWANENRIVTGTGGDKFSPDVSVTREQVAAILYRYAMFAGDKLTANGDLGAFPDAESVSVYANTALTWAISTKIITGVDGALDPQGVASRALVASVFYQYSKR